MGECPQYLNIKFSRMVFNPFKKVFYKYYEMRECCEPGLQIKLFQISSHFYSIFPVCVENYILSCESVYLLTQPSLLSLGRQPQPPSLNRVRSGAGSPGPTQRAAPSEGVLCREQPGQRHEIVDLPSSPRGKKTFLINSLRHFCQTKK